MEQRQEFLTEISSDNKIIDLHIKETFQYRDLILLFVKRDFTAIYKQTILGPLWAIIQPLLTTIVFTIIFGRLARLSTSDIPGNFTMPAFLFYMSGNICWSYFSTTLQATSNTFIKNSAIMGKVYFPRIAAPIATAISNLISFGIQFCMFMIIWLYYVVKGNTSIILTPNLLLIPVIIIQLMVLSTGCGVIISSVTTKYRDLAMLVGFGLQLWQYGSPIAYGLQLIPQEYHSIYMMNPVTPIITTFRYAVYGFGYFNLKYYIISWVITMTIFLIGLVLFSKIERNFMDTI